MLLFNKGTSTISNTLVKRLFIDSKGRVAREIICNGYLTPKGKKS